MMSSVRKLTPMNVEHCTVIFSHGFTTMLCYGEIVQKNLSINIQSLNACQTEGRSQIQFKPAAAEMRTQVRDAASVSRRWGY